MFRAGPHQQLPDMLRHLQKHWDLLWRQVKSQVVSAEILERLSREPYVCWGRAESGGSA